MQYVRNFRFEINLQFVTQAEAARCGVSKLDLMESLYRPMPRSQE